MADLHKTRTPDPNAGMDTVGWLFSAVAFAIIAVAAAIAYEANGTVVTRPCVAHSRALGILLPQQLRQLSDIGRDAPCLSIERRQSSGRLATFTAIRRASSLLSNLAAERRPGSSSK